jgi:hypothetical protein
METSKAARDVRGAPRRTRSVTNKGAQFVVGRSRPPQCGPKKPTREFGDLMRR